MYIVYCAHQNAFCIRSRRNSDLNFWYLGIYARSGIDSLLASGFVRGLDLLKLVNVLFKMVSQLILSKCFMPFPFFLTTISSASGVLTRMHRHYCRCIIASIIVLTMYCAHLRCSPVLLCSIVTVEHRRWWAQYMLISWAQYMLICGALQYYCAHHLLSIVLMMYCAHQNSSTLLSMHYCQYYCSSMYCAHLLCSPVLLCSPSVVYCAHHLFCSPECIDIIVPYKRAPPALGEICQRAQCGSASWCRLCTHACFSSSQRWYACLLYITHITTTTRYHYYMSACVFLVESALVHVFTYVTHTNQITTTTQHHYYYYHYYY